MITTDTLIVTSTIKCNFRCEHCCVEIENYPFLELTNAELDKLVYLFGAGTISISKIHIVGGEVTLMLPLLKRIIKQFRYILPMVKIIITTNGWFINDHKTMNTVLNELLGVNTIQISYDIFHAMTNKLELFDDFYEICKKNCMELQIVSSLATVNDYFFVQERFLKYDINIAFQKVVKCKRAIHNDVYFKHSIFDKKTLTSYCPGKGSINYYPSIGFSSCCGPLIFSLNKMSFEIANSDLNSFVNSNFFKLLNTKEIGQWVKDKEYQFYPDDSIVCNLCQRILSDINFNISEVI